MTGRARSGRHSQDGMALIVSLVILLSMTLLGLAAIQNTTLEERMAGNIRSENMALQAAETALRQGEAWLNGLAAPPTAKGNGASAGTNEVWLNTGPNQLAGLNSTALVAKYEDRWWYKWTDLGYWSTTNAVAVTGIPLQYVKAVTGSTNAQAALSLTDAPGTSPLYVIEEFGYVRDHLVLGQQRDLTNARIQYTVTGRGVDSSGRSEVILASRYQVRF